MNPGMNRSILSCVTCHSCPGPSFRDSPCSSAEGTSIPAACMTRITFFNDSCTASDWIACQQPFIIFFKKGEAYQLITLIHVHQSAQVAENLRPPLGHVFCLDVVTNFEPHERLAQQYRRPYATFACLGVARRSEQRFEQRIEYTLENVCNFSTRYDHKWPQDRTGERGKCRVSDLG